MIGAAFLFAYCGLSGFAASQTHRKRDLPEVFAAAVPPWLLRVAGSFALMLSLWLCVSIWPLDEGIVAWIMVAAIAGIGVVGVLSFAASWFLWLLTIAAIAGAALLAL